MPTLTLAVPEELKREMDSLPEMNWSEVARRAISEKVKEYLLFKSIVAKSKMTEKDADEMAEKVKSSMHMHLKAEMLKKLKDEAPFNEWAVSAGKLSKKGRFGRVLTVLSAKERESLKR